MGLKKQSAKIGSLFGHLQLNTLASAYYFNYFETLIVSINRRIIKNHI